MPFANSVVGGITLVRPAIRSPNYVANTTGWSINADGSAEFANAIIRGDLVAGGVAPNARMEFADTSHIPAGLQTFYGGVIVAALIFWFNALGDYHFYAVSNTDAVFIGTSSSGTVRESYRMIGAVANMWRVPTGGGLQFSTAATGPIISGSSATDFLMLADDFTFGDVNVGSTGPGYFFSGDVVDFTPTGGTLTLASLAGYRGVLWRAQFSGSGGGGVAASGGGANISIAGGGNGGGYIEVFTTVAELSANVTVTLAAGGAGGAAGNNAGSSPGASSITDGSNFSITVTAPSGGGGGTGSGAQGFGGASGSSAGSATNAGSAGTVIKQAPGGDGFNGIRQAGFYAQQPFGGGAHCGGMQRLGATAAGLAGANGNQFGGGGSGAMDGTGNTARAGGDGADGHVWALLYR